MLDEKHRNLLEVEIFLKFAEEVYQIEELFFFLFSRSVIQKYLNKITEQTGNNSCKYHFYLINLKIKIFFFKKI